MVRGYGNMKVKIYCMGMKGWQSLNLETRENCQK